MKYPFSFKIFALLSLFSLSACSSHYIAPGLGQDEGALIKTSPAAVFTAINSESLSDKTSLQLHPGVHKVGVRYAFPVKHLPHSPYVVEREIEVSVEDGKEYMLSGKRQGAGNWHYIWVADSQNADQVTGGNKPFEYKRARAIQSLDNVLVRDGDE